MHNGRTELHIFDRCMFMLVNAQRYRNEMLELHLDFSEMLVVGSELIFIDDNAHPHRAQLMDNFLKSDDI